MTHPSKATTARYVVVSPVRDEAEHIEHTIRSMVRQTVRPVQWILVNDGSADATGEIIERYAAEQPWILPVHRLERGGGTAATITPPPPAGTVPGRGTRALEAKEIEAFYAGYERITARDWEYLVKLDGDLSFEPDYFEKCLEEFAADSELGIGGGSICHRIQGELRIEENPRFHVRGATKIYRRACWEALGGVVLGAGWDTLDEVKANMLGWKTRSFAHLKVLHFRFTGTANGAWRNAVKNGVWSYVSGYHPLYMLFRCGKRLIQKPVLFGSIGLLYGFGMGYLRRIPQIDDKRLIQYLREQQLRRLSLRASIWR